MELDLRPITLRDAARFVNTNHRHLSAPRGWRFGVGLWKDNALVGVAVAGRPIARKNDDGFTLEVTRNCTDGTRNACSRLYGAIRRAARALGYRRLITYTRLGESGASLRAAGFRITHSTRAEQWHRETRPRTSNHLSESKTAWIIEISGATQTGLEAS